MAVDRTFIEGLPKAELHLHLEGSLEPDLAFAIAARNNIRLAFDSVEALRAAYQFSALQDFLDIYYQGMAVLQTERDFYDLTMAYCQRAAADNVRHVEVFFDPQAHTGRGVAFDTVVAGIGSALADANSQLELSSGLIMCFLRHLSEESAFETLQMAGKHRDNILGVGLDSSEVGHPPERFQRVFAEAGRQGYRRVAHAGEEGPPAYVRDAIELLGIERIDHGNRALEDPALVQSIVAKQLALTVCPLSNLKLCAVSDMRDHPLGEMLRQGLKATINSDDPAYFGGYINDNFIAVTDALDLSREDLIVLARNSFEAAFVDSKRRDALCLELDAYVESV